MTVEEFYESARIDGLADATIVCDGVKITDDNIVAYPIDDEHNLYITTPYGREEALSLAKSVLDAGKRKKITDEMALDIRRRAERAHGLCSVLKSLECASGGVKEIFQNVMNDLAAIVHEADRMTTDAKKEVRT